MSRTTTLVLAMALAVLATVILGFVAFLFMPGGHGTSLPAVVFFPYAMFVVGLIAISPSIQFMMLGLFALLALGQNLLYAYLLGSAWHSDEWRPELENRFIRILAAHVAAVVLTVTFRWFGILEV